MDLIFNAESAEATEHAEEALQLVPATTEQQLMLLAVLFIPLLGFLLTGLVGRRLGERPWIISVTAVLISAALATVLAFSALFAEDPVRWASRSTPGSPWATCRSSSASSSTTSPR